MGYWDKYACSALPGRVSRKPRVPALYLGTFSTEYMYMYCTLTVFLLMTIRCCSINGRVSYEKGRPHPLTPMEVVLLVARGEKETVTVVLVEGDKEKGLHLRTSRMPILNQRHLMTAPQKKSCLLYTSPSPRDATLSRMPSSA